MVPGLPTNKVCWSACLLPLDGDGSVDAGRAVVVGAVGTSNGAVTGAVPGSCLALLVLQLVV